MSGEHVVAIDGLNYRYPSAANPALKEIDLRIGRDEFVVVAGRSASGKSTFLRACCGLVPHFFGGELNGSISVAGCDALASGPGSLADRVGYLAQEPETQVVSTTVAAEISLPLELRNRPENARARAVEEVALALAIPHLLDRTVDSLSGGELQRVALAAALVTRPQLVLLDEPTSQLDPVAGDELIWLLRRLNAEWGVTIVLTEHRLERCLAAADRVLAFEDGRIEFDGGPEAFLGWAEEADPTLLTPAARLFADLALKPPPTGVRSARVGLARAGYSPAIPPADHRVRRDAATAHSRRDQALKITDLWVERGEGEQRREVLRGLDLSVARGERIALMGRNGAGKSTLLRSAAGLVKPVRGRVDVPAGIALLGQSPADYLVRERVGDELPGSQGQAALAQVGLAGIEDADPRDLSGGQRQRLALAITMAGRADFGNAPGLVAFDEPTRGLDPELKHELGEFATRLAANGASVVIATHDVEFAAAFADRVLLLGQGRVIADGPPGEVLSGGWYFATEIARILDIPGLIMPQQAAAALRAGSVDKVPAP